MRAMKGRVIIPVGVGAACLFLAAVLVSNSGTKVSLAQGKARPARHIEPRPSPAERHAGGRGGGGSSLATEAWERAAALEREASAWMARGEIKGPSSAKSSGGLSRPCVRMGKQTLCGVDKAGDTSDTTFDEATFGSHGTIPPEVAASWGRRFEEAGGIRVPHGSFFDGTNSEVWSGGGANKGWNPAGGEDRSGWADPARWVAGRKAAQRGVYQFDGVPEDAEYGDLMQSARWPYGYGAQGQGQIPNSRYGDRGQGTPDQFLAGVSRRYNNPTRSKYMDDMYRKLGAGRSSALDRMSSAVHRLDWEANMVYPRMRRELAVPVEREVTATNDGGADGGKDFLKKVSEMRFLRHMQEMPKGMDV
jgi:hypothetical protein